MRRRLWLDRGCAIRCAELWFLCTHHSLDSASDAHATSGLLLSSCGKCKMYLPSQNRLRRANCLFVGKHWYEYVQWYTWSFGIYYTCWKRLTYLALRNKSYLPMTERMKKNAHSNIHLHNGMPSDVLDFCAMTAACYANEYSPTMLTHDYLFISPDWVKAHVQWNIKLSSVEARRTALSSHSRHDQLCNLHRLIQYYSKWIDGFQNLKMNSRYYKLFSRNNFYNTRQVISPCLVVWCSQYREFGLAVRNAKE